MTTPAKLRGNSSDRKQVQVAPVLHSQIYNAIWLWKRRWKREKDQSMKVFAMLLPHPKRQPWKKKRRKMSFSKTKMPAKSSINDATQLMSQGVQQQHVVVTNAAFWHVNDCRACLCCYSPPTVVYEDQTCQKIPSSKFAFLPDVYSILGVWHKNSDDPSLWFFEAVHQPWQAITVTHSCIVLLL